jgi:hypothetical protein
MVSWSFILVATYHYYYLYLLKKFYPLLCCVIDGFGEKGKPVHGDEGAVPPNASLQITLELVSWKTVTDVTSDKKVIKKILKEGEGYERPNEGAIVKCNC